MAEEDDKEDARRERMIAFFEDLGLAPTDYAAGVLAPSLTFALGAAADAPARPWIPCGARNIGGRIRSIAQDPADARVLYAGAATGGVHVTRNGGDTWSPLGGVGATWPVGAVAVAPGDSRVIVVGTGETESSANPQSVFGLGIYRTVDGGASFTQLSGPTTLVPPAVLGGPGPGNCEQVAMIAVDPGHPHRFWAATDTGFWRWEPTSTDTPVNVPIPPGAFRIDGLDAGTYYTDVVTCFDPDETPAADGSRRSLVVLAGRNDGTVHRAVFDRRRAAATLTWTAFDLKTLAPNLDRVRLAVCAGNPRFVYAVCAVGTSTTSDLMASEDGGKTFTRRAMTEDGNATQGSYSLTIAVHPTRPEVIVVGNLNVVRSLDGGRTPFVPILDWNLNNDGVDQAQHADQHTAIFDHQDRNRLWIGNDGGLSMAPDVTADPGKPRFWRKRSHGLQLAQWNDISRHPLVPWFFGGGLQDNGSWAGIGGGTWLHVGKGDGGVLCYESSQRRRIYLPATRGRMRQMDAADPATNPLTPADVVNDAPELAGRPRNLLQRTAAEQTLDKPFVGISVLAQSNQILVAARNRLMLWNPVAATYAAAPSPAFVNPGRFVSAVAVAPSAPATEWWCGNSVGEVFFSHNAGVAWGTAAAGLTAAGHVIGPPPPPSGRHVTRIVVHPLNLNCVAVATGGDGSLASMQGRVYLTRDGGGTWVDLTGVGGNPLPPCPVTALAWDTSRAAASPQALYAGTLVGVWKLDGLPNVTAPSTTPSSTGIGAIAWVTFGNLAGAGPGVTGKLPLLLINDLETVVHPASPGAAAGRYEAAPRHKLVAATFGRGMFECDLGPPAAAPAARLFIRQHVVEDGLHYPRPTVANLNATPAVPALWDMGGDPRFPILPTPGSRAFVEAAAYDIRVDNRAGNFEFYEDRVDGVEFDSELGVEPLRPTETNAIYAQVQNRGTAAVAAVEVHLFWAEVPAAPPPAGAPDLPANFWANFRANPLPAPGALAGNQRRWSRVGVRTGLTITPGDPMVVRFDFTPASNLAGRSVALLAVAHAAADPIVPAPAMAGMAALIRAERRVAVRAIAVLPLERKVFVRDGVDDGGASLAPVLGGARSPDIIVVQEELDPAVRLADILDRRPDDRVVGSAANHVFVRVWNAQPEPVRVRVELWTAPGSDPARPPTDRANWTAVPSHSPTSAIVDLPAGSFGYARFLLDRPADPTPAVPATEARILFLAALVQAEVTLLPSGPTPPAPAEPLPDRTFVDSPAAFLRFFRALATSHRATMRHLRHDL